MEFTGANMYWKMPDSCMKEAFAEEYLKECKRICAYCTEVLAET